MIYDYAININIFLRSMERDSLKPGTTKKKWVCVESGGRLVIGLLLSGALLGCGSTPNRDSGGLVAVFGSAATRADDAHVSFKESDHLLGRGDEAKHQGNIAEAIRLYQAAAKESPTYKTPWVRLAELHYGTGHYLQAYQEASEAFTRDSKDANVRQLKALSSLQLANAAVFDWVIDGPVALADQEEADRITKQMRDMVSPSTSPDARDTLIKQKYKGARSYRRSVHQPSSSGAPQPRRERSNSADAAANPFESLK